MAINLPIVYHFSDPTPWCMGSKKRKAEDDDTDSQRLIFST